MKPAFPATPKQSSATVSVLIAWVSFIPRLQMNYRILCKEKRGVNMISLNKKRRLNSSADRGIRRIEILADFKPIAKLELELVLPARLFCLHG